MKQKKWRRQAACLDADPEAFFPTKGVNPDAAKRICAGCPVRDPCLAEALKFNEKFGVWGGLTERERRRIRNRQHRRAA